MPRTIHLSRCSLFRDRHDAWSAANVAGRVIIRFVTVALLLKALDQRELALWYLFLAVFGISAILEGGVKLVVTQQAARRRGNARSAFVRAVLRLYWPIVMVVCLLAAGLGLWWFRGMSNVAFYDADILPWLVFVLASGIGLMSGVQSGLISGAGEVAIAQRNELLGQVAYVAAFAGLMLGGVRSLSLPVVATLFSAWVAWLLNRHALHRLFPGFARRALPRRYLRAVGAGIMRDASRMMVGMLSYHMLTSVFLLLISASLPQHMVAAYGVSLQLFTLVLGVAGIWMNASFPRLSASRGDAVMLRRELVSLACRALPVLAVGLAMAVWLGPRVVQAWRGEALMLPGELLGLLAIMLFLENIFFTYGANLLQSQGKYGAVARLSFTFAAFSLLGAWVALQGFHWGLAAALGMRLLAGVFAYDWPIARRCWLLLKVKGDMQCARC